MEAGKGVSVHSSGSRSEHGVGGLKPVGDRSVTRDTASVSAPPMPFPASTALNRSRYLASSPSRCAADAFFASSAFPATDGPSLLPTPSPPHGRRPPELAVCRSHLLCGQTLCRAEDAPGLCVRGSPRRHLVSSSSDSGVEDPLGALFLTSPSADPPSPWSTHETSFPCPASLTGTFALILMPTCWAL